MECAHALVLGTLCMTGLRQLLVAAHFQINLLCTQEIIQRMHGAGQCGGDGDYCCDSYSCQDVPVTLTCAFLEYDADAFDRMVHTECVVCGEEGQDCCDGVCNSDNLACDYTQTLQGACAPCGEVGQPCCHVLIEGGVGGAAQSPTPVVEEQPPLSYGLCNSPDTSCDTNPITPLSCVECGKEGEECCDGVECNEGLVCGLPADATTDDWYRCIAASTTTRMRSELNLNCIHCKQDSLR